ncbi:MAG: DUF3823 domain-containing protein [Dysgonamonadaceae bacterium]|jgi:hypothetical protein|nr:DUF3823 domain-containing protein [Dysgonamonadaceae bacterium]
MTKVKNIIIAAFATVALSSCDMFKIDNYDGPNASLHGGIKDAVTGELVETDIQNGSTLRLYEFGWSNAGSPLTRVVKQNGEYRDDMMFAAHYKVEFINCNFYPFTVDDIEVKTGDNLRDFQVTPYIRVKNAKITREGSQIVATFNLQPGKEDVKLSNICLYAHTDIYVGDQVTTYSPGGSGFRQDFSPAIEIDESVTYRLTIDLTNSVNSEYFKYSKNYYFRVGAMASVSGVGTVRRNYAPHTVIKF